MGVPVITMMGKNFVSRCGESINLNLGLKNFIAKDEKDYVTKAVSLNTNKDELAKIRLNLRTKALESPLFDTDSFNLQFSNMIKEIWSNYLK
jgi:predicted O-linked N-acetylglucosamine transferase (SPINDLY family)